MIASLIAGLISGETLEAARRARRAAIAYALAGFLGLFGLLFLVIAAYLAVAERYGAIETAIGFGIGFLVIAGVVLLIHRIAARRRIERDVSRRKSELMTVAATTAIAILPTLLRGKGGPLTLLAPVVAVLGYAIYSENAKGRDPTDPPNA